MKIRSYAKINLGLEVLGKRPDGYHDILTLFQSVDFYDTLEFLPARDGRISIQGSDPSIPWDESNLISKAARLLRERGDPAFGASIEVLKTIPAGKGLGGGSSNAAATLWVLNGTWGLDLNRTELISLGRRLGADVPFFLEGGMCLGRERGDSVLPQPDLPRMFCLLALPRFPILTADIYGAFPASLTSADNVSKMMQFLESRDFGLLENRLEPVIFRSYPELEELKEFFQSRGAALSLVSGSGSAVFGLFNGRKEAERARAGLPAGLSAVLVETLSRDRYWAGLRAGV